MKPALFVAIVVLAVTAGALVYGSLTEEGYSPILNDAPLPFGQPAQLPPVVKHVVPPDATKEASSSAPFNLPVRSSHVLFNRFKDYVQSDDPYQTFQARKILQQCSPIIFSNVASLSANGRGDINKAFKAQDDWRKMCVGFSAESPNTLKMLAEKSRVHTSDGREITEAAFQISRDEMFDVDSKRRLAERLSLEISASGGRAVEVISGGLQNWLEALGNEPAGREAISPALLRQDLLYYSIPLVVCNFSECGNNSLSYLSTCAMTGNCPGDGKEQILQLIPSSISRDDVLKQVELITSALSRRDLSALGLTPVKSMEGS
jgi:hypothetical protein